MERIHKILSDNWAMRGQEFENLAAILLPSIVKGTLDSVAKTLSAKEPAPQAVNYIDGDIPTVTYSDYRYGEDIPRGSVMLIKLSGPLYSWNTQFLIDMIKTAETDDRISGMVLEIDGPGGMTSHVGRAASLLRNMTKPVATVVTDLMASAHFWIGTAADRVFAADELVEVGSVGVFLTYINFKEYFKANGIDYRNIYPDTADLKNKASRAVEEKNDETLFKEDLTELHRSFSEAVATQTGVAYDPALPLYRGEMFRAAEAMQMGIIDEMGEVEDAVRWVQLQARIQEANKYFGNINS